MQLFNLNLFLTVGFLGFLLSSTLAHPSPQRLAIQFHSKESTNQLTRRGPEHEDYTQGGVGPYAGNEDTYAGHYDNSNPLQGSYGARGSPAPKKSKFKKFKNRIKRLGDSISLGTAVAKAYYRASKTQSGMGSGRTGEGCSGPGSYMNAKGTCVRNRGMV